ncbi:MAG TPA: hypothetical protein EYH54_06015, partial [Nautiliaceae bacterium]|nr:hypothetical protein [Nautiliaceae bacterium]
MLDKNFLEEKRIELGRKEYIKFLIKQSIRKRKSELIKKNKILEFNDFTNNYLTFNINFTKIKNLENHFNLVIVGNFTRDLNTLEKSLELYLLQKAILLKGKFEFLSFFMENKELLYYKEDLLKLIHYLPVFYYNTQIRYGVSENSISLTYNEKEFILGKFNLEEEFFKEKLINFMDFFGINYFIRKGKEINKKIEEKTIISTKKDIIIDTEI